ncbi:MAG: PilW family protein [Sideroxydans sp.]|nr:PilW family protein [Sideroxydans sp.]
MNTHPQTPRLTLSSYKPNEAGFSLIEMMISITIGLMIIAALVGVLTSNSRSAKTNDRTSELQSNGRFALDHLKRELRHAGYRGYTWAEPTIPTTTLTVTGGGLNECGGSGFIQNIRQGIWGANDSNPFTGNCLSTTNQWLRGDVLVLRRLASTPTLAASAVANGVYFRSTYAVGEPYKYSTAASAPGITAAPVADFLVQEYVYYIGSDGTAPALRRIALQANGTLVDELVVSGIEHMEVQYGRYDTAQNTQYFNANQITGTSTDSAQTQWDDVNSVRVWLLSRNSTREQGFTNTNTYPMGDITYDPVDDNFRRQLFTAVIQLRN